MQSIHEGLNPNFLHGYSPGTQGPLFQLHLLKPCTILTCHHCRAGGAAEGEGTDVNHENTKHNTHTHIHEYSTQKTHARITQRDDTTSVKPKVFGLTGEPVSKSAFPHRNVPPLIQQ